MPFTEEQIIRERVQKVSPRFYRMYQAMGFNERMKFNEKIKRENPRLAQELGIMWADRPDALNNTPSNGVLLTPRD